MSKEKDNFICKQKNAANLMTAFHITLMERKLYGNWDKWVFASFVYLYINIFLQNILYYFITFNNYFSTIK
jgi:hypothetical protein